MATYLFPYFSQREFLTFTFVDPDPRNRFAIDLINILFPAPGMSDPKSSLPLPTSRDYQIRSRQEADALDVQFGRGPRMPRVLPLSVDWVDSLMLLQVTCSLGRHLELPLSSHLAS